jgi:Tol biopolymer transport system component
MLIVRVLGAMVKPAIAAGVVAAGTAGGLAAYTQFHNDAPQTAFERMERAGPRLVISEFGEDRDQIVAVDPADTTSRTTIATVEHADGFGIFATLAPDGGAVAYTALPASSGKAAPDAPAIAAIVQPDGTVLRLADDVDLLVAPVWTPDGQSIVVRKNTPAEDGAGSFELLRLGRDGSRSTITAWQSASIFPIAFSPDGSKLYFATLNAQGSDLYSVAPDGSNETQLAHLSDDITREWALSPDATQLAYSVAQAGDHPGLVAKTLDIATGAINDALPSADAKAQVNPTWKGDHDLTLGAVKPEGGGDAVEVRAGAGVTARITDNSDTMDVPLAWSPDGARLAVRSVEGATPFEAGASHIDLVDAEGNRARVSDNPDVTVVGWMR